MAVPAIAIHKLFETVAATAPDAPAVLFDSHLLTYGQLNADANRVAHRLSRLGVARGNFVGLCMERSPEVIVAILGILKAGAAYVPFDPAYPDERLAFMIADSATPIILTHSATTNRLAPLAHAARLINTDSEQSIAESDANPETETSPDDIAYVMYTSGSTGQPKGVLVPHCGVVRLVQRGDYCDFGAEEVFLLHSPLTFDASTLEIWGPLLNGGRLAILAPGLPAPDTLADAIRRHGVTSLWLTAGLFHLMVDQRPNDLARVRQVLAGGDVLSPSHVRKALDANPDGFIINGYGPTETTTFACCFRMTGNYQPDGTVPIGKPIPDTSVLILDEKMQPVSEGDVGELYIGGGGVAKGYLNRPDLTRERFVPDPFGEIGRRLYRTGDRVRVRPDGNIEFLGRLDSQVKIAGHRIEPEEIEAALLRHPTVRQAVVAARPLPSGDKQLVAYVVAADPSAYSTSDLKCDLGKRIPRHMIPAHFVLMDRLPLTPNGKVDRAALRAPESPVHAMFDVQPLSGQEGELASIWQRVLNRVTGPDDNFFDLGGTSLQLLEVHAILTRMLGREIPLMMLFEHPTIRSLSRHLAGAGDADPALVATRERARLQKSALSRRRTVS